MAMTTTPPSGEPEAHGSAGRDGRRRGRDGRLRRAMGRRTSRLAVGLVAAAVALTAAAVALAQGFGTFRDVGDDHYARDSVQWAVQNRITQGCRDGTYFCPERTVNRAESVTFLYRYNNNVIGPLENRVRVLEGRTTTTPATPTTTVDPNSGFVIQPTPTTTPLRKYTVRGIQATPQSFRNLVAGNYDAVFTLEATKAASLHDQDGDGNTGEGEAVILIQLEYRSSTNPQWKTWAVSNLKLQGDNLPTAAALLAPEQSTIVQVEDVPGRLPTSGSLRVNAYMADNAIKPDDDGIDNDLTTQYNFSWGLVLTEKRS